MGSLPPMLQSMMVYLFEVLVRDRQNEFHVCQKPQFCVPNTPFVSDENPFSLFPWDIMVANRQKL